MAGIEVARMGAARGEHTETHAGAVEGTDGTCPAAAAQHRAGMESSARGARDVLRDCTDDTVSVSALSDSVAALVRGETACGTPRTHCTPTGARASPCIRTVRRAPHGKVVHCRRAPYDVYVGRFHPAVPRNKAPDDFVWGNPFVIGRHCADRNQAIRMFAERMAADPDLCARARRELAGKVLGCWCRPHACHADVLYHIANGENPHAD